VEHDHKRFLDLRRDETVSVLLLVVKKEAKKFLFIIIDRATVWSLVGNFPFCV